MVHERRNAAEPEHNYSSLVVAALRAELERERAAHAQTHDRAELEILCLRSQLARRDAEIQAYVASTGRDIRPSTTGSPVHRKSKRRTPIPVTPPDAIRALSLSTERNRELEVEIKHLTTRVSAHYASVHVIP